MRPTFTQGVASLLLMGVSLSAATSAAAQQGRATGKASAQRSSTAVTAEDLRLLREALERQQQQIDALRRELQARDEQARNAEQAARQAQQAAEAAAAQAASSRNAAAAEDMTQLTSDVADLKTNVANVAINAQDADRRAGAVETLVNRFRFTGDIRVRGEGFMHDTTGCAAPCNDRFRARFRARLGVEGTLNQDFLGGIALATGTIANGNPTLTDPVSTNETLTSFFERKAIGLDRAYVTWQPQRWKWLSATGGKFAANWQKTVLTFDNDLNPEGFTVRLSKDLPTPFLKNVTVQPVLLFYNEVSGGPDANAVGGQVSTRWQLNKWMTLTPSYMLLNWNGSDAIAQAASPVTLPNPNSTAAGTPTPTPTAQPPRVINANAFTNASVVTGTGANQRRAFLSDFMYSDLMATLAIKTPWARFPLNITAEYIDNLRARNSQGQAGYGEIAFGQARNKNDFQFGYSFARIEQDAVISQFNESDYRAGSNVVQHRLFSTWTILPSTTASYTLFVGRTLNTALQNAARLSGIAPGQQEPFLKRMQLDLVYKF